MAEKDLLKLLEEKNPAEFSREQTDEMLARLGKSGKLRKALSRKLQFEQEIVEVLTRIEVPVDEIIAAVENRKALISKISTAVGIAAVVVITVIFLYTRKEAVVDEGPPAEKTGIEVTGNEPATPAKRKSPAEPAPVKEQPAQPGREPGEETVPVKPVVEKKEELPPEKRVAKLLDPDQVLPFEYTCFRELVDSMDTPGRDELRTWLDPAVWIKKNIRIGETRVNNMPLATLNGIYRLRPVWPEGGVLRLSLFNHQPPVLIHLWRGREGVRLSFSPGGFLSAYRQVREGEEHSGKAARLYGCQQVKKSPGLLDRVRGLDQVAFEIRHQEGYLLVVRGDHELMRAPMAGPPQEVYLEGRVHVSGICMYRGGPMPESVVVKARNRAGRPGQVFEAADISKLQWKGELPEKTARGINADRGVTLSGEVENTSADSFAALAAGKEVFREIVLRLEDITPGTAVFLGDEKGAPLYGIGFAHHRETGGVMSFVPPGDFNAIPWEQSISIASQIVPLWDSGQWLKLVVGRTVLRLFMSNDGIHWNEVATMQRVVPGGLAPFSTVGLRLVGNGKKEQGRKITLRHLEIRGPSRLSGLLPQKLAGKVPEFPLTGDGEMADWISIAVKSRPADTELDAWLRACAVSCLQKPLATVLMRPLLMGLVESVLADEEIPLSTALELVHEIALFTDSWDFVQGRDQGVEPPALVSYIGSCYRKIGEIAGRRGEKRAFSFVKPWLFSTPSVSAKGIQPLPPVLLRRELLAHMSASDWESVDSFCREIRYWNRRGNPQVPAAAWLTGQTEVKESVEWAEVALARRKGPGQGARGVPLIHHPLVTEYSKDGYNALAEFSAAIKGGAFNDACLILTSSDNSYIDGLLPAMQDNELLVSWRLALGLAFEGNPELSRTLQKKYAQLANLRLRKAELRGDVEAVEAVTRQFYGTEASVDAFLWMGDQALGIGESILAEGYYRRARKIASLSAIALIEARERLAAAFSGRDVGSPPKKTIRFGDLALEPDAFEKMVTDLRQRFQNKTTSFDNVPSVEASRKVPATGIYTSRVLGEFSFDPRFKDYRPAIPVQKTDWVGRQMALTVFEDYLLVSDRNDLRVYGLPGGELRWSHLAGNQRGGSREWPLVPMRPVVAGELVFVRMVTRQGPRLECLGLSDGAEKWVFSSRDQAATDPILLEGDVVLFNLRRHEELGSELLFTRLARDTGEVLDERSLVNFRRANRSKLFRQFQIGRSIDRLVATGSGCVICTDLRGRLLWVRKQPWRPFEKKSNWYLHHPAKPVFSGEYVIVDQPADESVTSLNSDTGRLHWKTPVRDLKQILGISSGKVIVSAARRLLALDFEDGSILWERSHRASKGFMVSGDNSRILTLAPVSRDAEMKAAGWGALGLMSWLDVADGKNLASWVVDFKLGGAKQGFLAGPMIPTEDGVFVMAGEYKGASRSLFRLLPERQLAAPVRSGQALDYWLPGQNNLKATVARTLFPGWTLLDSGRSGRDPFVREFPGGGPVFFTKSQGNSATQWGRMVDVPAGGKARLRLQLGSDGAEGWTVVVRGNGGNLATKFIPEVPPPSGKLEEYPWLEDSVPQGAREQGGWVWARKPDPVHSGQRSLMLSGKGAQEKSFRNSNYRLVAGPGDQLFAWVWIDPKDPPRAIQLKFGRGAPSGTFEHSVYWGDLQVPGQPPLSPTPPRLGNLPRAGQWVRLQIAAASIGIKPGTVLREMAFFQVDGTVYYDKVGILSRSVPEGLPGELLGPRRWTDLDIDLSRFGGKSVWLRVERAVAGGKNASELWRKIEVVQ